MTSATAATIPVSVFRLARLLVRYRLRHLFNATFRAKRARAPRVFMLFAVLVPGAYLGLFVTSFRTMATIAPLTVQGAALSLVCGVIVLASLLSKTASGEAVMAGSSENEFYLARPLGMARLVVARSLAGMVTDFFDALFLMPVLLAAALTFDLGARGVVLALVTSVIVQLSVSAAAQALQLSLVRLVPPTRRRFLWTALSLLSALSVAGLWLVATAFLRRPETLVAWLTPLAAGMLGSPLALIPGPLLVAATGQAGAALLWLALLACVALGVLALAALAAARAGRRGWEDATAPWAEATRGPKPRTRGPALGVVGKELRLLLRDRSRLVMLLAMPLIFVGVQVFGSAGWSYTTATPQRIGMLAFSLAAYLATLGPLRHMESERQAFWIIRSTPVSLGGVMARKALAWSVFVAAVALGTSGAVMAASGASVFEANVVRVLLLVMLGALSISWLAVAMGCDATDFSREGRPAVGLGSIYLFLLAAGLFNVLLHEQGVVLARGLVLYGLAASLYWITGIRRAGMCFDQEAMAVRSLSPGDGAAAAILLFLGARAGVAGAEMAGPSSRQGAQWVAAGWAVVVGALAAAHLWRRRERSHRVGVALGVALALAGAGVLRLLAGPHALTTNDAVLLLLVVTAEELIFRGTLQRALEEAWPSHTRAGRAVAFGVATLAAIVGGLLPWTPLVLAGHGIAGVLRWGTGRSVPGWIARVAVIVVAVVR